jgi:hypothetical protein
MEPFEVSEGVILSCREAVYRMPGEEHNIFEWMLAQYWQLEQEGRNPRFLFHAANSTLEVTGTKSI